MKRISLFCALFILFSCAMTAQADDSAFGGSGAALIPIKQSGVKMVNEHVVLNGVGIDEDGFKGSWHVTCDFTFENTQNKLLKFRMGFPFPVKEELGEVTVPAGHKAKRGDPLVYSFAAWADGKPIAAKHYNITSVPEKGLYYDNAYIWNMTFAPRQIIKIHHKYVTGVSPNAVGHTYASYVLKTGGLWEGGKIGYARLEVIPNVPTRMCSELKTPETQYLQPTLPGVKIIGFGADRRYIWDLKDFHPTQDLDFCLQTGKDYVRHRVVYPVLHNEINLRRLGAAKLTILKNAIFAQYGRIFHNPKLQAYFAKQWWYVRNPNYNDGMLSSDDKQAIAIILKATKGR